MMNRNTGPGLPPNPFMRSMSDKGKAIAIETDQPTNEPQAVAQRIPIATDQQANDAPNDKQKQKRIMASRQYSQKYRLKQQQYMKHLEKEAKALDAEVSILGARLKYMTHKKLLVQVENSSLKQKLSEIIGEYNFRQVEQVELNNEKDAWKQLYLSQQQQAQLNNNYHNMM